MSPQTAFRMGFRRRLALTLCAIPAAYFATAAVFALLHFGDYGAALPQFLRYVAAPAAIALGLLVCGRRLRTRKALTVGVSAIAILAALFAFEAVMSVKVFGVLMGLVGGRAAQPNPAAGKGEGLPPGTTPRSLDMAFGIDRLQDAVLGGVPGKPVFLCASQQGPVHYTADRYGFNNPDEIYRRPIATMVLGDSFVEGICLRRDQAVVGQLQKLHPATVGMRGSGPLFELAMLGRFGGVLRPQTVIMAYFEGNDWENLAAEMQTPWLRTALSQGAEFGPPNLDAAMAERIAPITAKWATESVAPLRIVQNTQFLRNVLALNQTATQLGLSYPKIAADQPAYGQVLARARQIAGGWGGRIVIVYIPQVDRFTGLWGRDFVYDQQRQKVRAAAAANDIAVLDLTTVFKAQPEPLGLYATDGHFSERGAALAARSIAAITVGGLPLLRTGDAPMDK